MTLGNDFKTVLAAARAGADWAWERIYHDLSGVLLGYLRSRGASEAEDLVGEVFLQVVRNLEGFEGDEDGFRSWVFTIAHRRIIDEARRRQRRPVEPAEHAEIDRELPPATSEDEALTNIATREMEELLSVLTAEQRDALALRFVAGFNLPEVAEVMGRTSNATKALQRRGLRALRRHLGVESQ